MKLKQRLFTSYLLVATIPLLLCGVFIYVVERNNIQTQVIEHLQSVASIQFNRIRAAQQKEFEMFRAVASRTQLRNYLSLHNMEPEDEIISTGIYRILKDAKDGVGHFKNITLFELSGAIIATTLPEGESQLPSAPGLENHQPQSMSILTSHNADGKLVMYVLGPVMQSGNIVAHMVIEIVPASMLSLVSDYTGLGRSGETVVATRNSDGDAIFLTPTRHDENSALNIVIPKTNLKIPIIQALDNRFETFTDFLDYRERPVIAVSRYIPEVDWGIVVKMDKAEVFHPFNKLLLDIVYLIVAIILLVLVLSLYLSNRIAMPIALLNETVNKILLFQRRETVNVTTDDEVGELAINFNAMTSSLFRVKEDLEHSLTQIEEKNQRISKDATRFKRWQSSSFIGMIVGDTRGAILDVNTALLTMLGYSEADFADGNIDWRSVSQQRGSMKDDEAFRALSATGELKSHERTFVAKDGAVVHTLVGGATYDDNNEEFIAFVVNISDQKTAEAQINRLAFYDDLTGALNRYSFERDLKSYAVFSHNDTNAIANRGLLMINLDKFAQFNVIYSEEMADELLKIIVQKIQTLLPTYAALYRYTGDTFFVLVQPDSNLENSRDQATVDPLSLASYIQDIIATPLVIEGQMVSTSASIGVLTGIIPSITAKDIKPLLELTVKKAKQLGGNQVVLASSTEIAQLRREFELMHAMQSYTFCDELSLVLQPQFDVQGNIVGSEALIRWYLPDVGNVRPDEFIPLAEQNGRIIDVGNWVLDQVCELISTIGKETFGTNTVSINISSKHIAQPDFVSNLLETLDYHGVDAHHIILELTESALIADFDLIGDKMRALQSLGIRFSIDDFGTGYSSLSYIQNLPVSELKIDKTFIDAIVSEDVNVPLVELIIQMADSLAFSIVAEGVESEFQVSYLAELEPEIVIQGYYFSKPVDQDTWLRTYFSPKPIVEQCG